MHAHNTSFRSADLASRFKMSTASKTQHGHLVFPLLDGMRGVAALLIVFRHTTPLFGENDFRESYLGVDLFFVLSGFVVANAYEQALLQKMTVWTFLAVRAIRLYPLYFVGLISSLIVAAANPDYSFGSLLYHGALSILFLPNPGRDLQLTFPLNVPTWSLFFEAAINIAYAVLLRVAVRGVLVGGIILCALGLVACIIFARSAHDMDFGWLARQLPGGLLRVTFSFYVGVLIYRLSLARTFDLPATLRGNTAAWFVIGLVTVVLTASPTGWLIPAFDVSVVFFVFPALVYIGTKIQPRGVTAKIFRLAGLASYAVYILHEPLGKLTGMIYVSIAGRPLEAAVPLIGYAFLPALVLICLVLDVIYDVPVRKMLRRSLNRATAGRAGLASRSPETNSASPAG